MGILFFFFEAPQDVYYFSKYFDLFVLFGKIVITVNNFILLDYVFRTMKKSKFIKHAPLDP